MKTFLLVRHGTTEWVDKHILHGITDIPLNDNGFRQAREAAAALEAVPASHLYTSPLTRCLQTAQTIAEAVKLQPVPLEGLKELNFGWLEGKPFRDHTSQQFSPLVKLYDHYNHLIMRMLSGESITSLRRRVLAAWQRIQDENHDEISIVVGHSAVFNNILIHHFGKNFPKGMHYYSMRPCSITEITIDAQGQAQLVRMDDGAHLSDTR